MSDFDEFERQLNENKQGGGGAGPEPGRGERAGPGLGPPQRLWGPARGVRGGPFPPAPRLPPRPIWARGSPLFVLETGCKPSSSGCSPDLVSIIPSFYLELFIG
uniref:Uncharacterized protein n=1 Tax=Chrysemys picta bellii TaxID=8478 RepID=A0A8C3H7K3_CHRPI